MQRIPNNHYAPRTQPKQEQPQNAGSALQLARRIRNEQGAERARQYLIAMEPFLAPAERYHIADQLGIPVPRPSDGIMSPQPQPQSQPRQPQNNNAMNMANPMQLISMLQALNPKGGAGGGIGMDPMALTQLMGMLGKK